jgi:hypothetical protein
MGDTYPPLSDQQIVLLSKGARLPVYLLLCNHPEGMTQRNLIVLTGMNDRTISAALDYLALDNLVKRAMSADGMLKWFTALGLSVGGVVEYTSSTTTINKDSNFNLEDRNRRGVVENTTPGELDTGGKSIEAWNEIWSELGMASVFKNDRSLRMARLPHITPEYVKKCRQEWRSKKKGGAQWAGAFLTMLEGQPVEERVEKEKSVEETVADFFKPRREE